MKEGAFLKAALAATGPNDGSPSRSRSTPRSAAMAEASVYIEEPFLYGARDDRVSLMISS